jgi:hypothetical protein
MWVEFKCNGPTIFSQRGGISKYNTCVSRRPPPRLPHLLSLVPCPPPPSSVVVGRDIPDSSAPTGVFYPKKGDPSNMTSGLAYLMDQSRGRIQPEHRRQEMTNSDPSPSPRPLWCPWLGTWRQMGNEGRGGGSKLGLYTVHIRPISVGELQHTQDLLDVT